MVSLCLTGLLPPSSRLGAADHGDTPVLGTLGRSDAQITDVFAFLRGKNLVLALCTNPAIPAAVANYTFAPDLTTTFHIDLSWILNRRLKLDPQKEMFIDDDEANSLRSRPARDPWRA